MEVPVNPPSPGGAAPLAEVVVVNGRLSGARRPLTGPLILFGQAPGCEVRLTVEGVQPLHAALVHGPDGFLLRDLAGDGGVLVNDRPASLAALRHGDEFTVGPFRFRLEAPIPSAEQAVEVERDALRIQGAAVVAQQTALNEEETRLHQQRGALEQQEEQLAGRLEERRRRLLELQEQTRQEREAFQAARFAFETEQAATRKELEAERDAASAVGKQARAERQRLMNLRKRLRQRWRRQLDQKEADLRRREKEASARESRLQQEAAKLDRTRTALTQERLRLNGDVELGRRRLREQGQELALAQQLWETCINQEHAERARQARELDARAAALKEAEHIWSGRERSVRLMVTELHRESAGLETRLRNQRERLAAEEETRGQGDKETRSQGEEGKSGWSETTTVAGSPCLPVSLSPCLLVPSSPLPLVGTEANARAAYLQRVADRLGDQRAHLLEQWQGLLRVQEEWRRGRELALAEMEATGRSLVEREQRLLIQERRLDASTAELRQRQQSLSQMRYSLEGWQARLKARDVAWEAERAALTAEVRTREEAAGLQLQRLRELARRREAQRTKEAEELATAQARCEDLRRQYAALWEECQQRRAEVAREQRDLAARMLAAEQVRLEIVGKAAHSARAERRIERLRQRHTTRLESAEREIEAARKGLAAERGRLEELAQRLQQHQAAIKARGEELTREQAAWEERQAESTDAEQRRRLDRERLQVRCDKDEHVIAQLREEVERVAGLLLEQADFPAPTIQAA